MTYGLPVVHVIDPHLKLASTSSIRRGVLPHALHLISFEPHILSSSPYPLSHGLTFSLISLQGLAWQGHRGGRGHGRPGAIEVGAALAGPHGASHGSVKASRSLIRVLIINDNIYGLTNFLRRK